MKFKSNGKTHADMNKNTLKLARDLWGTVLFIY